MAHNPAGVSLLLSSVPVQRCHSHKSQQDHTPFTSCTTATRSWRKPQRRPQLCRPQKPAKSSFALGVYRDEGALSEIDIAECLALCDAAEQTAAEGLTEGSCTAKAETKIEASAGVSPEVQHEDCIISEATLSCAQTMAWRRRLRQTRSASAPCCQDADSVSTMQLHELGSSILERRPKVQLAYQLQGCVSETAHLSQHSQQDLDKVLSGDMQLELWHIYSAGRSAEQIIVALHSQLGRVPTGMEAATALGFVSPDDLAKCLHDGQVAKTKLLATNVGLVRKLASQYSCAEVPMSDLIQEGLWGLERGLREYDPSRQAKVSTAVYWYIRDAVFKAKRLESNVIHVPLTTQEQIAKLRSATQRWQRQHPNQAPTATQLKELTDMGRHGTLKRVIQASLRSERSLDLPVSQGHFSGFSSDKSISWVDKLAYDDFRDDHEFQHDLKSALALLPDPMGVIVQEKYGLRDGYAKNYAEVAALLDIKKWKVAQYHKAAMKALRAQSQLAELAHAV